MPFGVQVGRALALVLGAAAEGAHASEGAANGAAWGARRGSGEGRTGADEAAVVALVLDVVRLPVEALLVQAGLVDVAGVVVRTRAVDPAVGPPWVLLVRHDDVGQPALALPDVAQRLAQRLAQTYL